MNILFNTRTIIGGSGGVQKWSRETFAELDHLSNLENFKFDLNPIRPTREFLLNGGSAYLWEQFYLPLKLKNNSMLLSPGNVGPISVANQGIVIHDLLPFVIPSEYSIKYRSALNLIYRALLPRVKIIFTVSMEQKLLISNTFEINPSKIVNAGAGVNIKSVDELENMKREMNLYFLFIGGSVLRKNLEFLLKIWPKIYKDTGIKLLVVGRKLSTGSYIDTKQSEIPEEGISWILDPTDTQLEVLYTNCLGLLHPSKAEGFGMPLLEAVSFGKFFLASSAGVAEELAVGQSKVLPLDPEIWMDEIMKQASSQPKIHTEQLDVAKKYTWNETAKKILEHLI